MAMLRIVDKLYGDKKIVWRADDKESRQKAIDEFKERTNKKWLAFRLNPKDQTRGEQITEFDEKAETIVLTPPVAGG